MPRCEGLFALGLGLLLAACGGAGAPAGPSAGSLILHGARGAQPLAADDPRAASLHAELDSLLAAPAEALLLAVEPAALAAARAAGALELRAPTVQPWALAGGRTLRARRLLVPLTDAVPSLRAGAGSLLLFLADDQDVLVAAWLSARGRDGLRAQLPPD